MNRTSSWSHRLLAGLLFAALLVVVLPTAQAGATELAPGGTFVDDNRSEHEAAIEAIAAAGITKGCNPPADDWYCPDAAVTRGQMATFLVRALELEPGSASFDDISSSVHAADIETLAAAGITKGCNPPDNTSFCPRSAITRGEMASMLARAFGLTASADGPFGDVVGSVHATSINAIAEAGITRGCNPPANDRFCPDSPVTRGQMASFLARAAGLEPIEPPDAPFHLMVAFTTHHRCCEARVSEVQYAARRIDGVYLLPGETFSMLDVLDNRVRSGNCQTSTTLFNSVWYAGLDEVEHRPHAVHYARYPYAIESTLIPSSVDLRFRNDTAHPVEIRAHYTGTSLAVELWGDNDGRSLLGDYTPAAGAVVEVLDEGGDNARVVGTETESNGRTHTVTRTITVGDVSESESWSWTYAY